MSFPSGRVDKKEKALYAEPIKACREWIWAMAPLLQPSLDFTTVMAAKRRMAGLSSEDVREVLCDTNHAARMDLAIVIVGNTYFNIVGCYVDGWYSKTSAADLPTAKVSEHPERFRSCFNVNINKWAGFILPKQEDTDRHEKD